ncbi:hypothetical protein V8E36_001246 [Tilletia maclaganii]
MSASTPPPSAKILVVGPPAGQIRTLLSKTNAIHNKHGPFDALFILGDLFAPSSSTTLSEEENELLEGELKCTIPTYFALGTTPLPLPVQHKLKLATDHPAQIAPNLFYLGHAGIVPIPAASSSSSSSGASLNLAFVGGQWDPAAWSAAPLHNQPDPPQTEQAGYAEHHITPRLIHDLLAQPSLALSKPIPRKAKPPKKKQKRLPTQNNEEEDEEAAPTTLAEARAQQAAKLAALTSGSGSSTLPPPPAGLVVEDETQDEHENGAIEEKRTGPAPPAIDILLLPYFPAGILNAPPASSSSREKEDKGKGKGKRKAAPAAAAPPPAAQALIDPASLPHPSMPSWGAPPLGTVVARARARYVFALGPPPVYPTTPASSAAGEKEGGVAKGEGSGEAVTDPLATVLPPDAEQRTMGTFYERPPFLNPPALSSLGGRSGGAPTPAVTRFISLARLGNEKKVRWFMALNLPLSSPAGVSETTTTTQPVPPNTTASPYGMLGFERVQSSSAVGAAENGSGGNANQTRLGSGGAGAVGRGGWGANGNGADPGGGEPNFRFSTAPAGREGPKRPPRSYVCRLCDQPGHWIQDCELASGAAPSKDGAAAAAPSGVTVGGGIVVPVEGYECRICLSPTHFVQRCPFGSSSASSGNDPNGRPHKRSKLADGEQARKKREVAIPVGPKDCWFCLSNPACAKHLVVGIGSECYVALPKGQLVTGTAGAAGSVPGGGHVLIIPINHTPSYLSPTIPTPDRTSLLAEREAYLTALTALYASHGCIPLSWEVGRSEGATHTRVGHTHTQVVPCPTALLLEAHSQGKNAEEVLADLVRRKGHEAGYEFVEGEEELARFFDPASKNASADYFRLQIGGGSTTTSSTKSKTFLLVLRGAQARFNLQWPRQTLAGILGTPERADWKVCARASEEEERAEAEEFKMVFTPFAADIGADDDDDDDDDDLEDGDGPDEDGY